MSELHKQKESKFDYEKPVDWLLSIRDVQEITGLKAIKIQPENRWIKITLENGVLFAIRNWKSSPVNKAN